MVRYFFSSGNSEMEVSEGLWLSMVGDETAVSYARRLAMSEIQETDIPEEWRAQATAVMYKRLEWHSRWVELVAFAWRSADETILIALPAQESKPPF